ncbi:monocarboxylate transporter 2-like [Amphiura filiformis]|uniref:monocarboxylate transporter 2-like n=1 Tax=Amphiura filiformis TaxID=82378 RepID=UPI003B216410
MNHRRPSLDSGYSWVVALAAAVVVFFQTGLANVFTVFVPEFEQHLQINASTVGLCTSIGMGLRGVLGPVWTALAKNISCRKLVMIGGLISCLGMIAVSLSQSALHLGFSMALLSVGSGIPSVTKVVHLKKYFVKKFNTAVSLVFTIGTASLLLLPPFVEHLVSHFGWRGAILIYGAMNLNICVAGALMIEPYDFAEKGSKENLLEDGKQYADEKSSLLRSATGCSKFFTSLVNSFGLSILTQNRLLVLYLLAMALHELVVTGWSLFLVSHTLSNGYGTEKASILATVGGGGALSGRLITGPVMDDDRVSGLSMFFILALGSALSLCSYPFINKYWALSGVSFMAGLCLGSTTPVLLVILKEIFADDIEGFAAAVGLQYMFRGVGMLSGGPLTGTYAEVLKR